jgi:molybdopterin molybdotransferase
MRPGKPLMAGRMGGIPMVGLPGNPVSAMVCGHIFLLPMIRNMLGLKSDPKQIAAARLTHALAANGPREHYMRAEVTDDEISVFDNQDSSLLTVLSSANALLVRPPNDPARQAGETLGYLPI